MRSPSLRIPQKHDHKVHEVVMAKPTPGEAHAFRNVGKHVLVAKIVHESAVTSQTTRELKERIGMKSGWKLPNL
jgi:hypothetical protein